MATPRFPVVSDLLEHYNVQFPAIEVKELQAVGDSIVAFMNPAVTDSPTKNWPLARFDHVALISAAYLLFVLLGPPLVKLLQPSKRVEKESVKNQSVLGKFAAEPIVLTIQTIYNLSQVALCAFMIKGAVEEALNKNYKFICNDFNARETGMALVLWVFYTSKILDFFDTIFMVLRGKWRQLSFLHVYHHTSIFLFYWLNLNVGFDGDVYYTIIVNSFIHFVMYGYYFLTTLNVPVPKPIKMLVTNMQLVQFVTMMTQAAYILAFGCAYPRNITIGYLGYIFSLYILFSSFHTKTYKKDGKKEAKKEAKKAQ